jgi:hypothetical protein
MTDFQLYEPFIAFVGAGASAVSPSKLPTWTEFNAVLLECLCESLTAFSRNRQPAMQMLELFQSRRDETRFFAPDFQAQLIEEEVGQDYFRVWQSLDTDVYGPVHTALAELAAAGRLAAIITTNFDRLIETALRKRGVAFQVFHDRATFEALPATVDAEHSTALPVIKIHGSIEDATSLIDTLRQRLVGRPESLMKALQILLGRHPWVFLGFSGADFSYDRHYLGILDAAADAKGFVFVAREGAKIQEGVSHLQQAYGAEKATIIRGNLSTWLAETFALAAPSPTMAGTRGDNGTLQRVKDRIRDWTKQLGPMAIVNILYSMLKSSGMEADALWLLRKTWKSYRSPEDTQGKSYDRYNYNYGMALLEAGFIRNPMALAEDKSNLMEWKEHADQNAYEYFARSYNSGKLLAAGGQLAALLAYRGEVGRAIELACTVTEAAIAQNADLELCDIGIASTVIYDIVQLFGPPIVQFRQCLDIAKRLGDEPRRAMLCAQLGRFLTYKGQFDEADESIQEAERVAQMLDIQPVLLASKAAKGLWLSYSGTSAESAVQTLREVVDTVHALDGVPLFTKIDVMQPESAPTAIKGRHPILCRILLDLNRAACLAGDAAVINQTLDELDELVADVFLGDCPHYYLSYAQCLLTHGDDDQRKLIPDLIRRARQVGEASRNPWVPQAANEVERHMRR